MRKQGFHIQFSLAVTLLLFWLAMSGHYTPLLIGLGVISVVGVVALTERMGMVDTEAHPIHMIIGAITYWPWLAWEIAKSSWAVTRAILSPKLAISPTLIKVKASQKTSLGVTTYANSITLTPGTISIEVEGNDLLVHALTKEVADDLAAGSMDKRVTRFERAR